jgi:Mg2+/Co2+ transporter CorB
MNGLLLESLEDIPDPGTTVEISGHTIEIMQVQDRMVKVVRILPASPPAAEAKAA